MEQKQIRNLIYSYLSTEYNCPPSTFDQNGIFYTTATENACAFQNPALKIVCMGKSIVITASTSILDFVKTMTSNKNREELFEFPFIYGQSIYYVPDGNIRDLIQPSKINLTYDLYEDSDMLELIQISGKFPNAISFDANGKTDACIAFCAKLNNDIIAMAAAGPKNDSIWEIGIDVLSDFRKLGIATYLVSKLTQLILEKDIVPIYCAASTNIFSQALAHSCNFKPYWVESYKNILDSSSVYNNILINIIPFIDKQ